ncbi:MAG: DUF1622 domain-containing protein [Anaerolineae bacterium]
MPLEDVIHNIEDYITFVGVLFDVVGVIAIVIGFAIATVNFLRHNTADDRVRTYRMNLGRALILCLEILVAADIIRTVAVDPTIDNLLGLGLLVLIRTFLSWTLELEVDGHWPWQSKTEAAKQGEAE